MADQGLLTIYIDGMDRTGLRVPPGGRTSVPATSKTEGLGESPNEFTFVMTQEPTELDEIVVDVSWDGGGDVRFFGGHIVVADPFEVGTDGTVWYKVRCLDYRWEADWDYITTRSNASAAAHTALSNITSAKLSGFTTTGIETGPTIDPFKYERMRYSEIANQIARDAAMLWDIDYDHDVRLFGPDAHSSGLHFDRQAANANFHRGSFTSFKDVMSTANRIIVEGDEGVQVIVEDVALQPPVRSLIVSVPGTTNRTVLARVGAEYLAARKVTPWHGKLTTLEETLRPGDTFLVSDSMRSLGSKTVRVERLVWTERSDHSWAVDVQWTTERVLATLRGLHESKPEKLLKTVQRTKRSNPRLDLPQIEPAKVNEPRVIPPAVIRNPSKNVPAQADEAIVQIRVDDDAGTFTIKLESTKAATDVKLAIGAIIRARNAITVSVNTSGLEAGEGADIFNNGTRKVEVATTSAGAANRWTVNGDADEMEITVSGDVLENAIVVVFFANLEGVDELDAVMLGDNTLDVDVAIGRQKSYEFPLQVSVPGGARIGRKQAAEVIDEAQSGALSQAYKGDRDRVAGYLDAVRNARVAADVRTADGVNTLLNTSTGKIGPTLAYDDGSGIESLQPAEAGAETTTGKSLTVLINRNLDNVSDTGTRKTVGAGGTGDADDVDETTGRKWIGSGATGDMDDINNGTTYKRPLGSYMDGSGRVTKMRRVTGAEDFDADDATKTTEVQGHIGGDGNPNVRDGSTLLIDVENWEVENIATLLDGVDIAATNPVQAGPARAGIVRARNAIDSSYRLAGDIEEGVTGTSDGVSSWGLNVPGTGSGSPMYADAGAGGGGGTGEGGDPIDP